MPHHCHMTVARWYDQSLRSCHGNLRTTDVDALSRMPFVELTELALILGEPHSTVHRHLTDLLAEGIVARVIHGTIHLPSSGRYCLTAKGIREAAGVLDFDTSSDFVRAYPMSREWLTLLIRRMDRGGLRLPTGFLPLPRQ